MTIFQRSDHHLYFLYGSNLNSDQLADRCGTPKRLGIACLTDFRLAFFEHSAVWDGGYETVVPEAGSEVWGVLYAVTFGQAEKLDAWQDVRPDGCGAYFLYPVKVVDGNGEKRSALVYVRDRSGKTGVPSDAQMGFIVKSAQEQGLPGRYVGQLKAVAVKKAGYAVPKHEGFEKRLLSMACHGCG